MEFKVTKCKVETKESRIQKIRKRLSARYNKGEKKKQLLQLFDALVNFLEVHNVATCEKYDILETFEEGRHIDTINKAVSWAASTQGYDFFYFLALRWGKYQVTHAKLYNEVYNYHDARYCLKNVLGFSIGPHNEKFCREEYLNKQHYYRSFLKKNWEKFGN